MITLTKSSRSFISYNYNNNYYYYIIAISFFLIYIFFETSLPECISLPPFLALWRTGSRQGRLTTVCSHQMKEKRKKPTKVCILNFSLWYATAVRYRPAVVSRKRFAREIYYISCLTKAKERERKKKNERRKKYVMCMFVCLCACEKERKMRFLESIDRLAEVVRTGHNAVCRRAHVL